MKPHLLAELFPLMDADQLKDLSEDIKANGLQEPIITLDGMILDGRNRFDACKMAGVEIGANWIEEFTGDDPLGYVISHNLRRRHLSTSVRAEIAAKIAKLPKHYRRDDAPNGASSTPTQSEAAKAVGVSKRSVQRAAAKLRGGKPPKKKPRESGWTVEEVKKDEALLKALTAISKVYGNDVTKDIRKGIGLIRAEVIALSKLSPDKMRSIEDLILANHWSPKKALKFLSGKLDGKSTVTDLKNKCLGTAKGVFTFEHVGFTITVKWNKK